MVPALLILDLRLGRRENAKFLTSIAVLGAITGTAMSLER